MDQLVLSTLPINDFVGMIARAVRSEMEARPVTTSSPVEDILTPVETAKFLGITLPTLRAHTRNGIVEGHRIGSRVRYRRSDVLNSLQRIRTPKTAAR